MNRKRLFRELDFLQIIKGDTDFGISVQNGKISKDRIQSGYSSGALSINTKRGIHRMYCVLAEKPDGQEIAFFCSGEEKRKLLRLFLREEFFRNPLLFPLLQGNLIVISTKCGEG